MTTRQSRPVARVLTAALAAAVLVTGAWFTGVAGQTATASLDILARDGRRSVAIFTSGSQEMVALDDLASRFGLTIRDDGGAITVGYKGKGVVLTPDQNIASVSGRLISLPAAPVRVGNRWLVPLDFITRALVPVYDTRLELRRGSHLLVVGDLRVPRVAARTENTPTGARVTVDITPAATAAVSQQGQRLLMRVDADALDFAVAPVAPGPVVQAVRVADPVNLAVDLGPRFASFRASTQPTDTGLRVTIDITGTAEAAPTPAPAPVPAAVLPTPTADAPLLPSGSGIRTVAIDAGHGGDDLGARGTGGLVEKDLTLTLARRLKGLLESRLGVRVVMTREDDRVVPPEGRSALANNNKADLFISLHANSAFRASTVGAVVYVASFTEAELATETRAPERLPVFGGGQRAIEIVPWQLAQIPHRDESARLAQAVVDSLGALGGRVPLAARPLEHAPMRVLEAANMPAVLLETGYLSNEAQEQALGTPDVQNAVAAALVDAVVRFRDRTTSVDGGAR